HGRLAGANRFGAIQYSVLQGVPAMGDSRPWFFLPVHTPNPFRAAVISSSLNPCTPSKNCPRCARAAGSSPPCLWNLTVRLLLFFRRPPHLLELNHELPNQIVSRGAAHHFCLRLSGCLRGDALHASHVRSDGRGTH